MVRKSLFHGNHYSKGMALSACIYTAYQTFLYNYAPAYLAKVISNC